jgi:hypothetical protein
MSESPETPTGVVVDEPMGRALLYAATAEGLLDNDPTIGDGFVGRLMSHRPSQEALEESFEQVVLGGKIFFSSFLPNYDGKGEIFEQQLIDSAPWLPREQLIEVSQISPDLVLGMLAAEALSGRKVT